MRFRPAFLALGALLATACNKSSTIEGDLSLGATKGGFRTVALVRNTADSLLTTIDAVCTAERAEKARISQNVKTNQAAAERFRLTVGKTSIAQVALSDSALKYSQAARDEQRVLGEWPDTAYLKNVAFLRAATDTVTEADINGHFRFTKRPKGTYLLYVEWLAPTGDNEFLTPVDATKGGKKTQNLDQSTVSTRLRCR